MNPYRAFSITKHGFGTDPAGAQVVYRGKLYDVIGASWQETGSAGPRLQLRTFNRERTLTAPLSACDVLERTW